MTSANLKDRILAQLQAHTPHTEIEGLGECIDELTKDGYVSGTFATDGSIIIIRITPKGVRFLENGGYTGQRRAEAKRSVKRHALRIAENVAVALISGYAGWALRGCAQPSSPECGEANRLINDSTSLSSASWSGLNEDSVASRAKSLTESLDNSASTLARDSMRMLEIETSAKHSKVRDGSRATPSGR